MEGDDEFTHCSITAEAFKPERWMDPDTRPRDYIPFALGPKICVGQHWAMRCVPASHVPHPIHLMHSSIQRDDTCTCMLFALFYRETRRVMTLFVAHLGRGYKIDLLDKDLSWEPFLM